MNTSHSQEPKDRSVKISKALAYLLRHGAVKENLPIDSDGYIALDRILQHNRLKSLKATSTEIQHIVASNDKQRFHIKTDPNTGIMYVCATQGHTLKQIAPSQHVLKPITNIEQLSSKLVHGTNVSNCISILHSGFIKKMSRNHVHLSPGITGKDTDVISGMRSSSNVYIHIKRIQEMLDSLNLVKSLNNVYLTSQDIPLKFIDFIQVRKGRSAASSEQLQQLKKLATEMKVPIEII
ncbi:tRNA 2'-phosphotransferase [Kluyveromyces lactis]|uniref:2'-phosphotransferase n=1 Tax=Kluyveromyces lactis (strain ATCC 8585 / CBS 2359 / DSM 70799 / NBRC 1267 / NRRL Y-1140 / WM37) TaxID=284590 RepID=Q6CTI8_KLULA|nr:uncharacterized protein KLLA0_C12397g [Kluyveromyces lactis]CAH01602.1 KLLA0C12397p [Kluyveromyces lactis]|eukprot:XP_452751.1 uncharacterized protein KLLA0_C12397g [Kluyveromyces lactis]